MSALLVLAVVEGVCAQVSVAPTAVFMSESSPFANIIVSNSSGTTQEITIQFRFGYSVSDEEGRISMSYAMEDQSASFTENLNAFPRSFLIEPGQRQTVRLAARGFSDKAAGTYWARANILASPISPGLETLSDNAVSARINMNFEQIIPVFFKKGAVSTGLEILQESFHQENDQGIFLIDLHRTGNSPFMGSALVQFLDSNGRQILERIYNLSAYYDIRRRFEFPLDDFQEGSYRANITFRTQRRDVANADLVPATPVQHVINFTVE
ncbi:MAG: hypothetical protein WD355_02935 [Balneolaceae bacterium]